MAAAANPLVGAKGPKTTNLGHSSLMTRTREGSAVALKAIVQASYPDDGDTLRPGEGSHGLAGLWEQKCEAVGQTIV